MSGGCVHAWTFGATPGVVVCRHCGTCRQLGRTHIAGPLATAQLATIAAIARTDVGGGRIKSQQEIDYEALMEHEAEERAFWRRERPLSRDEWAKREERG